MPCVTSIKPQKKNSHRYNIFVDGKFAFGLDEDTLLTEGLKEGQNLTKARLEELEKESGIGKLYHRALDFLEYRPRSEQEVRNYLWRKLSKRSYKIEKENRAEVIGNIIERIRVLGFLDDYQFAQWWVRQRITSVKPRGKHRIKSELFEKGVDQKVINKVFEELDAELDEEKLALKAAQKRLSRYKHLGKEEFKRKLGDYLLRRGFEWETVKEVINKLLITNY